VSVGTAELQRIARRRRRSAPDVAELESTLREAVRGEVRFDAGYRAAYSTDSSNYRQAPLGVVCPRDADDVVAAMRTCHRLGVPMTFRGAATSLAGQTTNRAVVIDTSRHLRAILAVDAARRIARVQPGVTRDQLAKPCEREHGLSFPPDTSTHAYATFGGMIANNSCGAHSVMTGRTSDNLVELHVALADGTRMTVGATSEDELDRIVAGGGRRGAIYASLRDLRDRYAELIRERYPRIPRRVSGFNLDDLLPENGFHVARALAGTEGTCAATLEATVALHPWPRARALLILAFDSIADAGDAVPAVMEHRPMACEAIDDVLVEDMRAQGMHPSELPMLPEGDAWLIVEFGADTKAEADERAREVADALNPRSWHMYDDDADEERLWKVREAGLGATAYLPGAIDHYEGWEDAAVPPERLGAYLRDFQKLLDRYGYDTSKYGHFGQGLVHCRINFGLRSAGGLDQWRSFMDEVTDLVVAHGGVFSGEHGDGQSKAQFLDKIYGPELVRAFEEFKAIWDPDGLMNPHKVVEPYRIDENLKLGTDYNPAEPETHFAFAQDGGSFAHAALRCVGAGKCRDTSTGTMCPSYVATLDEEHTTRGRARILFEMLRGDVIRDGFRSHAVHDALDLCLACKGCKGECPVSVDMAKYKAEFLAHHYKGRLRPPAAYSMGLIMLHARLASRVPRLANAVPRLPGVKRAAGISPARDLPRIASKPFMDWWRARAVVNPAAPPVVLFPDTFNNFLHPEVLRAAVEVLEDAGHRVVVPERRLLCCGRPLYDYGMLDAARLLLRRLVDTLRGHARAGTYVVGVEPSCVAVFRDELVGMLPHDEDAKRLSLQTLTMPEFLQRHCEGWDAPRRDGRAVVHGHCHQKAVMGMDDETALLERLGLEVELLDSGCCGLAGSFGFEASHHDLSVQIARDRLLPLLDQKPPDALVIADGFSCKTQVEALSAHRPVHAVQVVAEGVRARTQMVR
jgi:FAD/FMN-containing dehydrogenase/Fe-S oxidoreductase